MTAWGQENDYKDNWAKSEIDYMKNKGIISGYPNGEFRPDNNMSKAEFYKVVNGIMGFVQKSEINFDDVDPADWYYGEVQKGAGANYIIPGTSLNAEENITRGEVARIIGIIFGVEYDKTEASKFNDSSDFPEELKGTIGGLKKRGYINGYPDGSFRANAEITRAEVVKILYGISGEIVNSAGTVSKNSDANLIVSTKDVVLKDMTIGGNLYLTEGIGEGNATLDNVTVKGKVIVNGGGSNSVSIKNSNLNSISISKQQSPVRVVFENTIAGEIKTVKQVKLELTKGTAIKKVELDGKVELSAENSTSIDNLNAISKDILINSKGTIKLIKSANQIKVNESIIKANVSYKVVAGKLETVNSSTKTTSGSSTQNTVTLNRITIKSLPDKTDYTVGDELDITGLVVEGIYSDGSKKAEKVKESNITGFDSRKPVAKQVLTIKIGGKTTTFTISIWEKSEVNKTELARAIAEANKKHEADYTKESWTGFILALDKAIGVNKDKYATQEEVDDAADKLIYKMNSLVKVTDPEPVVDKSELIDVIEIAEKKNSEDYTHETWEPFMDALEEAIEVKDNPDATQRDVNQALENLNAAMEGLEEREEPSEPYITNILPDEDVTLKAGETLEVSCNVINAPEGGRAYFRLLLPSIKTNANRTVDKNSYNYEIKMAETVTGSGIYSGHWIVKEGINATGLEVEVNFTSEDGAETRAYAAGKVNIMIEGPVEPEVDKTALVTAITEAMTKNEDDYTEESWMPFEEALFAAKEVNENEAATQDEVDTALADLNTCMNGLVIKEDPAEKPKVTVDVKNSSPTFFPALIKLKVDVENIPDSAKYDVVYQLSGGEEEHTAIYDLGTWTTESIFFNPKTITDKVNIRIYDAENNLLYTFTDVVIENPMIPK